MAPAHAGDHARAQIGTRPLGRTGRRVSQLALGTAALGSAYGIPTDAALQAPEPERAVDVIRAARARGISLFDTAPAYGTAESLLGRALDPRDDCTLCSKLAPPTDDRGAPLRGRALERAIARSVETSLERLRRPRMDVLQLHNATLELLGDSELIAALVEQRRRGLVAHLGVSVYREDEALAAMQGDVFEVVQIGLSILDQRPLGRVVPAARRLGVAVVTRSALLKGALSPRGRALPARLARVQAAADTARRALNVSWEELPGAALRFCLGIPGISSTLIGVHDRAELDAALAACTDLPAPEALIRDAAAVAVNDPSIVNPALWELP